MSFQIVDKVLDFIIATVQKQNSMEDLVIQAHGGEPLIACYYSRPI